MKKQTTNTPTGIHGQTIVLRLTKDQINSHFLAKVKKPKDGSNDILTSFLTVADEILLSLPSFTEEDFLSQARRFGDSLPYRDTHELFQKWTETLVSLCKLERTDSCYSNGPLFVVR